MNSLLRNVLENYLDCLTEREFDAPFLAILHEEGFFDIHFLHGQYEFGKDFIAKMVVDGQPTQYVFQTKAGDISFAAFRELRMQIEDIRTISSAHPGFDAALPRMAIAVLTGQLTGGAAIAAQEYKKDCIQYPLFKFDVWDKENLLPKLSQGLPLLSVGHEYAADFFAFYGAVQTNQMEYGQLEKYCRKWQDLISTPPATEKKAWGILLENEIISNALFLQKRIWLACMSDLLALRMLLTELYIGGRQPWLESCIDSICRSFSIHANPIIEIVKSKDEPAQLCEKLGEADFITYPVFCLQALEIAGLWGLLQVKHGDKVNAEDFATHLVHFINRQPGCIHPISDNYAASLVAPALLLGATGHDTACEAYLRQVVKWVCDRYQESEFGLAAPMSTAQKEVDTLIGYIFDFIALPNRRESYLATILLDLLTILDRDALYELAVNDLKAVGICPSATIVDDTQDRFLHNGKLLYAPNILYSDQCAARTNGCVAPHHKRENTLMIHQGLWWESVAVCSTLRDRHQPVEFRYVLQQARQEVNH